MEDLDELLSDTQVCRVLGISKTTLWRMERRDPRLPKALSLDGIKRRSKAELVAYLAERKAERGQSAA